MPRTKTSFKKDQQCSTPEQLEEEQKVLELRKQGQSYRAIAEELGLSGPGQANKVFQRAVSRYTGQVGPELIKLEEMRLDDLQEAIWDMAMAGDLKAVETVLRVMERRAKLRGLDHTDKMAAAQLKIEADKVRLMAIALGRALDSVGLSDAQKEQANQVMFTELRELTAK